MEKEKTFEEVMKKYEAEEGEKANLRVRVQILEDGEVVDEHEGNGIAGVMIESCDDGECDGEQYGFVLGGQISSKDGVLAKYTFNKRIDRFIDVGHKNPLQELANMFGGLPNSPEMPF